MKHYKTVQLPAHDDTVLVKTTCDLCQVDLVGKPGTLAQVYVSHRSGYSDIDGGRAAVIEFDLCGKCFDGKLVPWLEAQGAKPDRSESAW